MKVIAGVGLATFLGAVVGILVATTGNWAGSEGGMNFISNLVAGGVIGGVSMALLGWIMAAHGSSVGGSDQQSSAGPIWGLVTGATYGLFLGPVFAAIIGVALGQPLAGGLMGLYLGPLAGIVAWESSFMLSRS